MADLSAEARDVLAGMLAGRSLDELAPAGSPVRAEVEQHLIASLSGEGTGTTADAPRASRSGGRSRKKARPDDPVDLPGGGLAVAYSDGASRGNPGPAAIGVHILAEDGAELLAEGQVIEPTTNNVAEYRGAIRALRRAAELGLDALELRMDSELVVKQLTGEYRVKQPALAELKAEVDRLRAQFRVFRVKHVRREKNRVTDHLANEALDGR